MTDSCTKVKKSAKKDRDKRYHNRDTQAEKDHRMRGMEGPGQHRQEHGRDETGKEEGGDLQGTAAQKRTCGTGRLSRCDRPRGKFKRLTASVGETSSKYEKN